jgi:hypothetical protein
VGAGLRRAGSVATAGAREGGREFEAVRCRILLESGCEMAENLLCFRLQMFNSSLYMRTAIRYGICVLIAIFVGYQLATWDDMMSFGIIVVVIAALLLPLLLKWHHFWLVAAWNTTAMVFFLPGRPRLAPANR